tara:strand:- start:56 stop:1147 length:1092 start_codon:yes stop_codon:yes gene_type:complete
MAYIGKEPTIGNFQKCDAISVVNGQAAYTLQVGGTNVVPESVNHMLVSLNGILQAPTDSFTVSGSTLTFASNLATGDVIDFVMILGNVLDLGVPSDSTVTNAKTNFTTTSSAAGLQIKGDGTTAGALQLNCEQNSHGIKLQSPAHSANQSYTLKFPTGNVTADKVLKVASVSGSGTTGIGQLSFDDAGGGMWEYISSATASNSSSIDFTTFSSDYRDFQVVISCLRPATNNTRIFGHFYTGTGGSQAVFTTSGEYKYAEIGRDNSTLVEDNTGADQMRFSAQIGNDTSESANFEIIIYAVDQQGYKQARSWGVLTGEDSARVAVDNWGNLAKLENVNVTGIKIFMESGNITSGKFSLYGRKHS